MNTVLFLALLFAFFAAVIIITVYLLRDRVPAGTETSAVYPNPDFSNTAGFSLTNYPNDEILIPREYRLVNSKTGEIRYEVVPNNTVYLRFAPQGSLLLPTEYKNENYETTAEYPIDDTVVTHSHSAGRKALLQWSKDGFDYALYAADPEMNLMGGLIDDFVQNTTPKMATSSNQ